ncbi:hypothetical protein ANN_01685 [Periplaneta americana]|uniref:Uncharacterized protein n=1 Tax=Periplaneta americana TaxID=6978 RepID=A0ABQ8TU80_PERAM|nr:hypothetical protein ANN_01685 [Periplaneta americana]
MGIHTLLDIRTHDGDFHAEIKLRHNSGLQKNDSWNSRLCSRNADLGYAARMACGERRKWKAGKEAFNGFVRNDRMLRDQIKSGNGFDYDKSISHPTLRQSSVVWQAWNDASFVYSIAVEDEVTLHGRIARGCQTIRTKPDIFERVRTSIRRRNEQKPVVWQTVGNLNTSCKDTGFIVTAVYCSVFTSEAYSIRCTPPSHTTYTACAVNLTILVAIPRNLVITKALCIPRVYRTTRPTPLHFVYIFTVPKRDALLYS